MTVGFRNWKNAVERDKGFHKHGNSKEHLSCYAMWEERERHRVGYPWSREMRASGESPGFE